MIFFSVPKQQKLGKRFKKTNKVRQVCKFIVLVVIVANLYYSVNALQQESDIAELAKPQEVSNSEIVKEDAITRVVLENLVDEEYLGYKVVAFLEIPKIELETNVLAEYSKKGLDKCVSKFWGSAPNCVGNFCIAGHNYQKLNMFKNVYKLKEGDTLYLTDNENGKYEYEIYDVYKVKPQNTKCLAQNTNGKREITLITCNSSGSYRIIVKAREV